MMMKLFSHSIKLQPFLFLSSQQNWWYICHETLHEIILGVTLCAIINPMLFLWLAKHTPTQGRQPTNIGGPLPREYVSPPSAPLSPCSLSLSLLALFILRISTAGVSAPGEQRGRLAVGRHGAAAGFAPQGSSAAERRGSRSRGGSVFLFFLFFSFSFWFLDTIFFTKLFPKLLLV